VTGAADFGGNGFNSGLTAIESAGGLMKLSVSFVSPLESGLIRGRALRDRSGADAGRLLFIKSQ